MSSRGYLIRIDEPSFDHEIIQPRSPNILLSDYFEEGKIMKYVNAIYKLNVTLVHNRCR